MNRLNLSVKAMLLMAVLVMVGHRAPLNAGPLHGCDRCPDCGNKVCQAEPTTVKEKKHCWEVECKDICIPRFKWWWECCETPPRCGQVKTVKVLKKKEYECEKCGYKWEVKTVDCDCCPTAPTK